MSTSESLFKQYRCASSPESDDVCKPSNQSDSFSIIGSDCKPKDDSEGKHVCVAYNYSGIIATEGIDELANEMQILKNNKLFLNEIFTEKFVRKIVSDHFNGKSYDTKSSTN